MGEKEKNKSVENVHAGHRERMKSRLREMGGAGFNRHQLVEMLLFFGIPRRDTNELAHRLVDTFGTLSALFDAPFEELMRVPGMTANAATLIRLCDVLMEECQRERFSADRVLDTTEKLANYILPHFVGAQTERVLLVCMDNSGRVLADGILSEGSVTSSEINIRQALQLALRCNATMAVMAHNHPGGQPTPSRADLEATMAMAKALAVADIRLADHLIVAGDDYVSMRETPFCAPAFHIQYTAGR